MRKQKKKNVWYVCLIIVFAAVVMGVCVGRMYLMNEPKMDEAAGGQEEEKMTDKKPEKEEQVPQKTEEELLRETVDALTLEEKAAQLFMVTPEQLTGVGVVVAAGDATRQAVEAYPVGGVIYFRQNLESPEQVKKMLANMQTYSMERIGVPMLLSIDEEGGQVTRISGTAGFDVPEFPYMSELGANGASQKVREAGEQIGSYLKEYGFNMDCAPDADVLINPENQVVKYRSFGSDAAVVSQMALAQFEGLKSQGIVGIYKHFPGHGGTTADTHEGYGYIETSLEELRTRELVPFQAGIDAGAQVIMAGHISCPNITGDTRPATLSSILLQDILREEMGFEGMIITDAMNMGAITQQYSPDQAAVEAMKAGVDMILMPEDFHAAYQGILDAVQSGELTEDRIEESVCRIWKVKKGLQE